MAASTPTMMSSSRAFKTVRNRAGLTLLELILSIAVLAALTSVLLPPMALLLDDRRLNRAGDLVQIEMSKARLTAMRSGQVMVLSGQIGGDRLRLKPYFTLDSSTESATAGPSALILGADQAAITPPPTDSVPARDIELPAGVSLQNVEVVTAARALQTQSDGAGDAANRELIESGDSQGIFFYPDGTCSDAVVVLSGGESYDVRVVIRGISGQSRVFETGL